jgi:7,8-dihydropterin-6-yl-methyl-4-(beta-D-ribofuranosyl)aminobenzene 5'-phosphate synthase
MSDTIIVTVLVENTVRGRDLMAEHGLSFHLQAGKDSLLFDTGQSALLVHNASRMEVDLSRLGAMALSHGHYDHAGGLCAVWKLAPKAPLYAHPGVLVARFARSPEGGARAVGIGEPTLAAMEARASQLLFSKATTEVLPGVFLTGEIPRVTDFEDVGGPFFLDDAGARTDPIPDDQALFFDSCQGLVVLLGCAHAGVVNTLQHIGRLTHNRPIHAVFGGMHLVNANPQRIARTIEALRPLGVDRLGPAHCSGLAATVRLWQECPHAITACSVGSRFGFQQ